MDQDLSDQRSEDDLAERRARAQSQVRRHLWAYLAANALLLAVNAFTRDVGGAWWVIWPIIGWGFALSVRWFYVRSVFIDEAWAEERTTDLRYSAYDLGHIEDIEKRYETGQMGHRSPLERDGKTKAGKNETGKNSEES